MPTKKAAVSTADKQILADLRAQLDQIDGALHDMLRARADVIEEVRKAKPKQSIHVRPGREAQMLRALVGRPSGRLPDGLVVRLWREMISAFTLQEGVMKVAVYAPDKGPDLWDLSRDHYGSFTPLVPCKTAQAAVKAVLDEKAEVAIVPHPLPDDKDLWWPLLAGDKANNLCVFQILPFEPLKAGRSNARNSLASGVIVGRLYPELTGDDRSFLGLQSVHVPEAEMRRLLSKAGYKVRQLLMQTKGRGASAPTLFWVEVEGYVGRADTRLGRLRAMLGSRLQYLLPLGGYAVPLKNGRR